MEVLLFLSSVTQFSGVSPFIMIEQLTFGGEADDIVLLQGIQFEEHLVIIVAAVHDKGCFTKQGMFQLHGGECDIVNGSKAFFAGRMDLGKEADWMVVLGKDRGFGYMIAFL